MDWTINAPPVEIAIIGDLKPVEVLYDFDGPRIFSVRSPLGDLLCFLADDDGVLRRFIAAPTNMKILTRLKKGFCTVRDALDQPWVWFIDVSNDDRPIAAWLGALCDAPADVLPAHGVMLWPHLEPILALRAIGDNLSAGRVPISVIRQVLDGAATSLKKIANTAFDYSKKIGRKTNVIRQFYDLHALGFSYHSFEVSFRMPTDSTTSLIGLADESTVVMDEIAKKLECALSWAIDTSSDESENGLSLELLEALEKLVPPKTGPVKCIEVRGRMFRDALTPYRLTRAASTKVRAALRSARSTQEQIVTVTGRPGEFDKDNLSFTLRETDDGKDHQCRFAPELYDELYEAFDRDDHITIVGRETLNSGEIDVLLVSQK